MPKNKSLDANWEADFLIANAKSFQRVVTGRGGRGGRSLRPTPFARDERLRGLICNQV